MLYMSVVMLGTCVYMGGERTAFESCWSELCKLIFNLFNPLHFPIQCSADKKRTLYIKYLYSEKFPLTLSCSESLQTHAHTIYVCMYM